MKEKVVQCHGCLTCHGCPSALEGLPSRVNWHPDAAVRARGRFDRAPVQTVGAQTDVAREADIIALVEKTVGAFGALHIAFNNAGIEGQFGPLTTEQTVEH